jgi:sugar/nucleoside kinase (ribokinase family)
VLGEERVELPAVAAEVVDATGAGDALAAGFLVGGPELAVEAAARCVSKLGAMP